MKNLLFISLVVILSSPAMAGDRVHKKLTRLYGSDVTECLEYAKKVMKRQPEKAIPYYYACLIYLDKEEKATNTMSHYRKLNSAIDYARKFDRCASEGMKDNLEWVQTIDRIEGRYRVVYEELITKEDQMKYADLLATRLGKLKGESTVLASTDHVAVTERTEETGNVSANDMFRGMPTGYENIPSGNVQGEKELLRLINEERKKKGMTELEWDENLTRAARYHAADLGTNDYFDHDSHDRSNGTLIKIGGTFERIRRFYHESFVNSENIAAGNSDAEGTYEQWYTSKGHYDNMFNSGSKKVGIGMVHIPGSTYGYYWVFCSAL